MSRGKRLVIYFFYDKDGIADRYVDYFLNGLSEVTDKFIIVANGKITPETRKLFLKYSEDIIVRKNEGLDAWAYKEALEYEGWDKLREYYEVCLVNSTIMGPVYPFSEMFDKMSEKENLDFWGVTKNVIDCRNGTSKSTEYIQSQFIVYRNRFLFSKELKKFWCGLLKINNYKELFEDYEVKFTDIFNKMGFEWETYIDNKEETKFTSYYLLQAPKRALQIDKCPIFEKRSFFEDQDYFLQYSMGENSKELFDYIRYHTEYDIDMILETLIRTCNQYDIVRTLGLCHVLPSNTVLSKSYLNVRLAVIMHVYYFDIINDTYDYAKLIPKTFDIYITTPHKDLLDDISKKFKELDNKVEIRLIENRGRDVSSLLVGTSDIINKYDYICFYHDKKVTQAKPYSIGRSFAFKATECALHNSAYICNIIDKFEREPRLGLLTNTPPHNSGYYDTYGTEWGPNFDNTCELAKKLNLNVPLDFNKPPVAPLGTVFWFRTKAMQKLFDYNWKYSDFPKEPNSTDGTLLHAIERIYSYVVQDSGYYPAYILPDSLASIELIDFMYYIRNTNRAFQMHGIYGNSKVKIDTLHQILNYSRYSSTMIKKCLYKLKWYFQPRMQKYLPAKLYNTVVNIKHKMLD